MTTSKRNARFTITLAKAADTLDAFKRLLKPGECLGFYARLDDAAAKLRNYAMLKPYADRPKPSKN